MKTVEGRIAYSVPEMVGTPAPFRSKRHGHLNGRSEAHEDRAVEMLARGLPVRDIDDALKDESGRLLLSRTAVLEMGERL